MIRGSRGCGDPKGKGRGTISTGAAYPWESVFINGVHFALLLVFEHVVTVLDKASVLQ